MSKPRWIRVAAYAILALAVIAGATRATGKWLENKPEWSYYRQLTNSSLESATGPEKPIFGYLPGFKAMLTPFVAMEPYGFIAFLLLNALSCIGSLAIIYRNFSGPRNSSAALLCLSICSAVPIWFALQNNQLLAPSLLLVLLAFSRMREKKEYSAGLLIAFAVLVKTLPLPLLAFPLLRRQWRTVATALVAIPLLSFSLAAMTDGFAASLDSHLRWPKQVMAQNPQRLVTQDDKPQSFSRNQSPAAELVRLAKFLNLKELIYLMPVLSLAALLALAYLSFIRIDREVLFWECAAGWLAWVAFAAPFGRYYYLMLIVPALYGLGLKALSLSRGSRNFPAWVIGIFAISLLAARSSNPMYAFATTSVLCAHLILLAQAHIFDKPPNSIKAVN